MNPATYMWKNSCQKKSLNSASSGRTLVTSLLTMSKPLGLFIQPLTVITRNEPVIPADHDRDPREEVGSRSEIRSQP